MERWLDALLNFIFYYFVLRTGPTAALLNLMGTITEAGEELIRLQDDAKK